MYDEATHSILVFGGMTQDDPINAATVLNDLWKYDIGKPPHPRAGVFRSQHKPAKPVRVGSPLHRAAANSWNEIKPEGQVPPPRYYHVAALQVRGRVHARSLFLRGG